LNGSRFIAQGQSSINPVARQFAFPAAFYSRLRQHRVSRFGEDAMFPSRSLVLALRVGVALCALIAASGLPSAFAADEAPERARLAALVRQLDLVDRLAAGAAQAASEGPARYRFDYARLREDVSRVRAGVKDYLSPPRAQPRDPAPLAGHYKTSPVGTEQTP
jgi:RAQPRD family integrative conjugative element protein